MSKSKRVTKDGTTDSNLGSLRYTVKCPTYYPPSMRTKVANQVATLDAEVQRYLVRRLAEIDQRLTIR